jgi:mRNA interferase MazF
LSQTKRRPALVVAPLAGDDIILCQITSQAREDLYSVRLEKGDFTSGGLTLSSRVRPNRLFTADARIVLYRAGTISAHKLDEVVSRLIEIIQRGR